MFYLFNVWQILKAVEERLDTALHHDMTSAVLNQSKADGEGHVYWDDFVGDGDLDSDNKTLVTIVHFDMWLSRCCRVTLVHRSQF